jgi:hypothetical protein
MNTRKAMAWGFALAMAAAASTPAVAQASPWPWSPEEPQGYYSQTWHDGFRAGEDTANHDMSANRSPDLCRHADYRKPDLGPISDEQFREGFRFAYQAVVDFRLYHVANPNRAVYGWGPPD